MAQVCWAKPAHHIDHSCHQIGKFVSTSSSRVAAVENSTKLTAKDNVAAITGVHPICWHIRSDYPVSQVAAGRSRSAHLASATPHRVHPAQHSSRASQNQRVFDLVCYVWLFLCTRLQPSPCVADENKYGCVWFGLV